MNMKKAAAILAGLLVVLAVCLGINHQPEFSGERVKNPDAYLLDIRRMNGTDRHTLALNAGDTLQIEFETEQGALRMTLAAPDGTMLYDGNGTAATHFEIGIDQSGIYSVTVAARNAKGKIHIHLKAQT